MDAWNTFKNQYIHNESLGFSLDTTDMNITDSFIATMKPLINKAYTDMYSLEAGAIANNDENRQVGHYWLRNSDLSPTPEIKKAIDINLVKIIHFAKKIHSGEIQSKDGHFKNVLCIGIGGSALGPQLLSQSLAKPSSDKMELFFADNTDPDGIDTIIQQIGDELSRTLVVVISKSGKTPEPQNMMLEVKHVFEQRGLNFAKQAVAITSWESYLFNIAKSDNWLDVFPMWEWVGGRTSVLAGVGLLPAALQGINIENLLDGAKKMDLLTREHLQENPAMRLALAWYFAGDGRGKKDMVVIPYKDRLATSARYLQQLVMESLGKEKNITGETVNQGIAVYGNKGSTDQHSYIQQLRDGVNNFFVMIIDVLNDRAGKSIDVESGITSGDYLCGFAIGTSRALADNNRQVINITINKVDEFSVGMLIALYERAVGFYASMIGVNAYHQPGVEAGKKAAATVLDLQKDVIQFLHSKAGEHITLKSIVDHFKNADFRTIFKLLEHMSANSKNISRVFYENIDDIKYSIKK